MYYGLGVRLRKVFKVEKELSSHPILRKIKRVIVMDRGERTKIAEETLEALDRGFYENPQSERIEIEEDIEKAVNETKLYRPDDFSWVREERDEILSERHFDSEYPVRNETTLEGARRLWDRYDRSPYCLNFASAKNPGGGFLQGSGAQEESLARSSALYPCLKNQEEYYRENKRYGSSLYMDYMIYSPEVPVIRNDEGRFLEEPYPASFLTAPAVNRTALERNEPEKVDRITEVMRGRIEKVLSVAVLEGHENLVLGAWGCGVFGNSPKEIAELFAEHLRGGVFDGAFREVRFSVYDPSRNEDTYRAFAKRFG